MNNHLSNLRLLMKKEKFDSLLISSTSNIIYLTNFSGFGTEDRDAFLLITKNKQYIFTHGIYKDAAKKSIESFELLEMKREKPVSKSLKNLIKKHKIKSLGVEEFDLKVSEYKNLLKYINKKTVKPTSLVNDLRKIKSRDEVKAIKIACQVGDKVYSQVLKNIRVNISEKELSSEIDSLIRQHGAEPSFPTIVAFAENAAFPHHVPTEKKLMRNMFILMDFGVKLGNYCSDMTRTLFFGKATIEQKKVYMTVLEAQKKAIQQWSNETMKQSGSKKVKTSDVDKAARKYIESEGYPTIPHSLGHGIGLEVHEAPRLSPHSKEKIENGMVFSIEPGIYLPGKFGIRIEDLFVIRDNELIQLTTSKNNFVEVVPD